MRQLSLGGVLEPPPRVLAVQRTLSGTWEPVVPPPRAPEPPPPPPPAPPPVDPRQAALFDPVLALRRAAEAACERLDAAALRELAARARAEHPRAPGLRPLGAWADAIDELVGQLGGAGEDLSARDLAARALQLVGTLAARRFPQLSPSRRSRLRAEALRRAAARLFAEEGAAACLHDGRPAGYLHLAAGLPEEAVVSLRLQAQALAPPGRGRVLGYLGEALWRCGHGEEAVLTYEQAYREEPGAVDEKEITCRPVLERLGDGALREARAAAARAPLGLEGSGAAPRRRARAVRK